MDTRAQGPLAFTTQPLQRLVQGVAVVEKSLGIGRNRLAVPLLAVGDGLQGSVEQLRGPPDPGIDVRSRRALRREGRVVGRPRQNPVHGAQLTPDGGGEGMIVADIVAAGFGRGLAARRGIEGTAGLVQDPGPGVALVADEGLGDRQDVALSVAVDTG